MFPPNLFRPGSGDRPPHLAGREREIMAVAPMEADLRGKRAPSADIVLHGPRGNGKTVLLDEIGGRLRQAGADVVNATPTDKLASVDALANALAPEDGWRAALRRLAGGTTASRSSLCLNQAGNPPLEQMLATQCAARPLALLVDEAHLLSAEVGRALLNASQNIRRMGTPFLLVLAGTPGIAATLQKMQASFWERARRIAVGRLLPGEDEDALMAPLTALEASAADKPLALLLEAANRYPYFIQEIGNALVTALNQATTKRIDAAVAKQALALFLPIRCDFYDNRRMELLQSGFLPHAEALAPIFADGKERLPFKTVEEALERHCAQRDDQQNPATVLQALIDLGLIWAHAGKYEAGLPSLLGHLGTCTTGNRPAPSAHTPFDCDFELGHAASAAYSESR